MESVHFVFEGSLALQNRMDFYEVARFQYAASRLLVKLDNFRKFGEFPKTISYKNSPEILILPSRRGSFSLEVIAPLIQVAAPSFINVPLESLLSYVIDRVFKSAGSDDVQAALANNAKLIDLFAKDIDGRDDALSRTIEMLSDQIDKNADLTYENKQLYERLISDRDRRISLYEKRAELSRISEDQEIELLTMAAPLLKEMNVPLRKSSKQINIYTASNDNKRLLLSADKTMADAVQTEIVDRHYTDIDINIVQFNKENGWGKFENDEWDGRPSFSVPGDILDDLKTTVLNAMREDLVQVECRFVRSAAGKPLRIIISDVSLIDE